MHGLFIVLFVIVVIALIIFGIIQSAKRRQAWQQFANSHGLSYSTFDTVGIPDRYYDYQLFKEGHSKKASNLCMGKDKDLDVSAFDYQYITGSGKDQQTHYLTCFVITSPLVFKHLSIRPESIFDKIGEAIGFDPIQFESAEFSKKFHVKCEDKKFAYDIVHARMIEFLMQDPKHIYIEAQSHSILFHRNKRISIPDVELLLIEAHKFIDLTPDYVRQQISSQTGTN